MNGKEILGEFNTQNVEPQNQFDRLFAEFSEIKKEHHQLSLQHERLVENNLLLLEQLRLIKKYHDQIQTGKLASADIVSAHQQLAEKLEISEILAEAHKQDKTADQMIGAFLLGAKKEAESIIAKAQEEARVLEERSREADDKQAALSNQREHSLEELESARKDVALIKQAADDYALEQKRVLAKELTNKRTDYEAELLEMEHQAKNSAKELMSKADSYSEDRKLDADDYAARKQLAAEDYMAMNKEQLTSEEKELKGQIVELETQFNDQLDVLLAKVEDYLNGYQGDSTSLE